MPTYIVGSWQVETLGTRMIVFAYKGVGSIYQNNVSKTSQNLNCIVPTNLILPNDVDYKEQLIIAFWLVCYVGSWVSRPPPPRCCSRSFCWPYHSAAQVKQDFIRSSVYKVFSRTLSNWTKEKLPEVHQDNTCCNKDNNMATTLNKSKCLNQYHFVSLFTYLNYCANCE